MDVKTTTTTHKNTTYTIYVGEGDTLYKLSQQLLDLPANATCDYGYTLEFSEEKVVSAIPSDSLVQEIVKICKLANNKMHAIKLVRDIAHEKSASGIGLVEAKNLVERFW